MDYYPNLPPSGPFYSLVGMLNGLIGLMLLDVTFILSCHLIEKLIDLIDVAMDQMLFSI